MSRREILIVGIRAVLVDYITLLSLSLFGGLENENLPLLLRLLLLFMRERGKTKVNFFRVKWKSLCYHDER
jgi:hypothetical protein